MNTSIVEIGAEFLQQLNTSSEEVELTMKQTIEDRSFISNLLNSTGLVLSTAMLAWLARGGTLLAWFLASLPAWQNFDPIPILDMDKHGREKWIKNMKEAEKMEAREHQGLHQILESKTLDSPPDSSTPSPGSA